VDVVVKGRNVVVPDHFRQLVAEKMDRMERYDQKVILVDVELFHEKNPRQAQSCQRVELTCRSRGPVIRSEATAKDFYAALDAALAKLEARLRRAADRRRVHHGRHTPVSVASATAALLPEGGAHAVAEDVRAAAPVSPVVAATRAAEAADAAREQAQVEGFDFDVVPEYDGPGRIVRRKIHPAKPMTLDQALFEMELVGHDFYLFSDADSGAASVVYRRKGYDYGVIRLES
jgi:ribosomal subunit interface protein